MASKGLVFSLTCLLLTGCTSSAGMEDILRLKPSSETTSSITRPTEALAVAGDAEVSETVAASAATVPAAAAAEKVAPVAEAIALAAVPTAATAAAAIAKIQPQRFRDAKPINFGRVKPKHYAVHGVDVSRWQGDIDWIKLRSQGANFAFIKATDGGDHLDPMFKKNWRGADAAGLKRGAYHFFYWCRTAGEQAEWFIRNVPRIEGALPPVIDVEYNGESRCKMRLSTKKVREKMQVFMDKLEAYYGQRPIIYTAPDFYADHLADAFPNHPFWLRAVAQHPSTVYPGRKWVFWQYSGSGLSHGVEGKIDLNVFSGSAKDWNAWSGSQTAVADANLRSSD